MLTLLLFAILMAASLHAEDDLLKVQQEIKQIEQHIHQLRLKSIGAELQGNEYMRVQWGKYADQIEESENYDVKILKLEKELEGLQQKERELLIQFKQGPANE